MAETWTCPVCRREYGDPLYHGPSGHAPPTACFCCWCDTWAEIEGAMRATWAGRAPQSKREKIELTLILLAQGHSRQHTAKVLGVHRRTIWRWICMLRKAPQLIPDWWIEWATSGGEENS